MKVKIRYISEFFGNNITNILLRRDRLPKRLLHTYATPGIIFSAAWTIALIILSCVRLWWGPQPCMTIEDISGFYGPGVYWAWVITTISAMVSTLSADRDKIVSIDFIGSSLYALASMGDLHLRFCQTCDQQIEFQLKASLQVISTSSILSFLTLFIGEFWHKDDNTVFSSGRWQLWKAFLLAPLIQGVFWVSWSIRYSFRLEVMFFLFLCIWGGGLWYKLRDHAVWRTARYSYLLLVAHQFGYFDYSKEASLTQPTFTLLSGAKLSDLDQALTLATTILVMMVQWKAWRRVLPWVHRLRDRYKQKDERGRCERSILPIAAVRERIL
jgi:hypothetical protein